MSELTLVPKIAHLAGQLRPARGQDLTQLHTLLAESLARDEFLDTIGMPLSFERADDFSVLAVDKAATQQIETIVEQVLPRLEKRPPRYRVFRREVPIANDFLRSGSPSWASGASASQTLGPYRAVDGRWVWFDFFSIIQTVALYIENSLQPAILFPANLTALLKVLQTPGVGRPQRYKLPAGSVWINARLFDLQAPNGSYVGLKISGGQLNAQGQVVQDGDAIRLKGNAQVAFALDLVAPDKTTSNTEAGADVQAAQLSLPATFGFTLHKSGMDINEVAPASWNLFGQVCRFTWNKQASPHFEPALQRVLVPFQPSISTFSVRQSRSPFCAFAGAAAVEQAGWALAVAFIDITKPTAAEGAGGMALQTKDGLSADWKNLTEGPVQLSSPWLLLQPNFLAISEPAAGSIYAHQEYLLWPDETNGDYSTLTLHYSDAFPFWYLSTPAQEMLGAISDAEIKADRPVEVSGLPLAVRTKVSLFVLAYSDTQRLIALYDDNILFDNFDPDDPDTLPEPIAIAIRNALFTTTPVNGCFLFGELAEDNRVVRQGNLLLTLGLFYFLPTLPDPYAANLGLLGRQLSRAGIRGSARPRVTQLLITQVKWAPDPSAEGVTQVDTAFLLAPLPEAGFPLPQPGPEAQTRPLAVNEVAAAFDQEAAFASNFDECRATAEPLEQQQLLLTQRQTTTFARSSLPQLNEPQWDDYFDVLTNEFFALLDVSTNADLMGISFNYINQETHLFMTTHVAQDTGENAAILQVVGLDMSAQARFARAITLPQVSWEPLINLTRRGVFDDPPGWGDPDGPWNLYPNDGGPTRFGATGAELVPLAPLPVVDHLVQTFNNPDKPDSTTWALFALPFGLKAFAMMQRTNGQILPGTGLSLNQPLFPNDLRGGLQIQADAGQPPNQGEDNVFKGATLQLNNVLDAFGNPTYASNLGRTVGEIFNREFILDPSFGIRDRGVPLKRIDFSGYGASTFSDWRNKNAMIAQTSQARFDVFVGRTAHEVIQVRSILYPWGIRVVRTITVFRVSSSFVYRFDSGWQAESDGLFDFAYRVPVEMPGQNPVEARPGPYEIHPGIVHGLFKVREIKETDDILPFTAPWVKTIWNPGDPRTLDNTFINANKAEEVVTSAMTVDVKLQPVYFDADVAIGGVVQGDVNGRVPAKKILGFVQVAPAAQPLSPVLFKGLIDYQLGAIGGPVDCVIALAETKQKMRINRIEVSPSVTAVNNPLQPIFTGVARGSVILPKDGSWSMVQQSVDKGEVNPIPDSFSLPLIQQGKMTSTLKGAGDDAYYETGFPNNAAQPWRLANGIDLLRTPQPDTTHFGFLQNTGTQKALFRLPAFQKGVDTLLSQTPEFSDGYRLINATSIFPNIQDAIPMPLGGSAIKILEEGYQLAQGNLPKELEVPLPAQPLVLVDEAPYLKIYVEYKDDKGSGKLNFGLDSLSGDVGKKWLSKMNNISMVVDLGPIERMMIVSGKFDSEKGAEPGFVDPVIKFNETYLQPIIDLLTLLSKLSADPTDPASYADILKKGLDIAMSNSPDSWTYRFHAVQEIPVLRFPPPAISSASDPLRLEAGLRVGCYFNQPFKLTTDIEQLLPSAGGFLEFYGRLSVMCASVGAATIYATGSVNLALAADLKLGPILQMSYGFGAEIVVGLPVAGNVSLLFMVGVDIYMDKEVLVVGAFLLFKGRAEILGGIVTITIMIEAKGSIKKAISGPDKTEMIAQVTFAVDISIAWVINISFSESWQESRQVA